MPYCSRLGVEGLGYCMCELTLYCNIVGCPLIGSGLLGSTKCSCWLGLDGHSFYEMRPMVLFLFTNLVILF